MSPKPKGIAARAGHWSARHRKTAIFGWLAFIVIAFVIGGSLGQQKPTNAQKIDGETRRAETILEDAGFPKKSGEMVLVQSKTETGEDAAFKAAIADVAQDRRQAAGRRQRHHRHRLQGRPLRARPVRPQGRSRDRRSTGSSRSSTPPTSVAARHPGIAVEQFGDASMTKQLDDAAKQEEGNSQLMSFGMTLLILALTFGALVAASVPVMLALTAVLGTSGVIALVSQVDPDRRHRDAGDHAHRPRRRRRLLAVLHPA